MRIAFITYEYPPETGKGGIGTYVAQLSKALPALGWDVHVFVGSHTGDFLDKNENHHVHHIFCSDGNDFNTKVVRVFTEQHTMAEFDLMECPEIGANGWEIKNVFQNVPLVVRLHASNHLVERLKKRYVPFTTKMRFVLGAFRRLKWDMGYWKPYNKSIDPEFQFIQLADYISAPSEAMKSWALKNWQINPKDIEVFPNIFIPSKKLLEIPVVENSAHKTIVFFGRLNVLKGLVNATRAMKKILKLYPQWKFRVIGDDGNGPYLGNGMRDWMKAELKHSLNRVEFLDGMDYELLPNAIEKAEIVLLPSLFESFSYTCIEAMVAGKAVVGSNSGGMLDLIKQNNTGLLVNPENVDEIYVALKRLMDDDAFRYRLSLNARQSVLNDFDCKMSLYHFDNYYRKIIERPVE